MFGSRDEAGVTIGQFAVVFPLFMLFIVVLLDFGRFSSLKTVLHEGIHQALQRAITVPNLDIDPRGRLAGDVEYQRLKLAREKAAEAGLDFINSVGLIRTQPDAALAGVDAPQLLDLVFTENRINGPAEQTRGKVGVLMPGECLFVPKLNHTECNRETLGTTAGDPAPMEPPIRLIERHPVKIVSFATFDSFTPLLFSQPIKIEQFAYRQPIPQGPFPAFEDPGLNGGFGAPPNPGDGQPLGDVEIPPEPPVTCIPDWQECLRQSGQCAPNIETCQSRIPAYWAPPLSNGKCDCLPATDRP